MIIERVRSPHADVVPGGAAEVLGGRPVEVRMKLKTAEYAIVGSDRAGVVWIILFDVSFKRGDWLRPITGWRAGKAEIAEWRRAIGG